MTVRGSRSKKALERWQRDRDADPARAPPTKPVLFSRGQWLMLAVILVTIAALGMLETNYVAPEPRSCTELNQARIEEGLDPFECTEDGHIATGTEGEPQ